MGSLFGSLNAAAGSMRAFERALNAVQNNVTNASTPGYARQVQTLNARRFSAEDRLAGGVDPGDVISMRADYAEKTVRRQQHSFGFSAQKRSDLAQMESIFPIAEGTGINGALSKLYESFSLLTVSPNDASVRQVVLDRAGELANEFRTAAVGLTDAAAASDQTARSLVSRINSIASQIRDINVERRRNFQASKDAGLDAQLHAALEELAEYVDLNTVTQDDGSVTVLIGGQTPITIGDQLRPISVDFASGVTTVYDADGKDITGQIKQGRLGASIEVKNTVAPALMSDLDRLAQSVADRVNGLLAGGLDRNGAPPIRDLFSYDPVLGAARTIQVTDITPQEIAAASVGAPGGNGNALELAALAGSYEIDGLTFSQYFGNLSAKVGRQLARALGDQQAQEQLLSQARALRSETSGVSLDNEAAQLIQLQRGYQATAKLLTVLNDLTGEVLGLIG